MKTVRVEIKITDNERPDHQATYSIEQVSLDRLKSEVVDHLDLLVESLRRIL